MEDHEDIDQMFGRFQVITNNLRSLGKIYTNQDNVRKILRSLPKIWRPKVTAIQEAKDLNTLRLEELLGSLKVHEIELKGEEETTTKKGKAIAFKTKTPASSSKALKADDASDEDDQSEENTSDEDEISFISRKIKAMWKKKGGARGRQFRKFAKETKGDKDRSPIVCYECKKPGHIKAECPTLNKEKRRTFHKKKSLMATWEDMDLSSSDDEDNEEANICLMANTDDDEEEEEDSEVIALNLEEAFNELLTDSSILSSEYKALKKRFSKINKELEKERLENERLREENQELKTVNHRLMENKSKDSFESDHSLENIKLQNEISDLNQKISKFVYSSESLDKLLKYSRKPNDKSGIGFIKSNPSSLQQTSAPISSYLYCSLCGKTGHISSKCFHKDRQRYCKTSRTNHKGPKSIWVPKKQIISVADLLNRRKETPVMVPGQWVLTTHDGRKVYVPRTPT